MAQQEFIGYPDRCRHIEDAERPLAALVASISDLSVEALQHSLEAGGIPEPDKKLRKMRFEGRDETVIFEPVRLAGAMGINGIFDRIKDQFIEGDAVALYHTTGQTEGSPYTWTLLLGYMLDDDAEGAVQAMDPRSEHATWNAPHKMREIIRNSTAEGTQGIYAFAVNTEPNPDASA